ncbi:MAG TPA: flagellar biosynthesis protein FlgF [Gammaproteobacteria bacterium]|nr:flagellar biosynthesis protein FlgF [Gammaproteobacteria bacterium]
MDRMLYLAMSGARQTLVAQGAVSHNLANASSTGFRADLEQFRAMPVFGDGLPTRAYALEERPGFDLRPGVVQHTGNPLDVAIQGPGWIAVQTPDGGEAYTRAGDLRLGTGGLLETSRGDLVLGNEGPIAIPPAESITLAPNGSITIRPVGEQPNVLVVVDRLRLVNPAAGDLEKGADGLFRLRPGLPPVAADASVRVEPGAVEASNVSTVDALVRMIELGRKFETQLRMMRTAQENDARSAQMLQMPA